MIALILQIEGNHYQATRGQIMNCKVRHYVPMASTILIFYFYLPLLNMMGQIRVGVYWKACLLDVLIIVGSVER